jgi:hypothetical protein
MDAINTVTISIDEYFDLRKKADMNEFLMTHFGEIEARINEMQNNYWRLEGYIEELRRGNNNGR